MPAWNPRGSVSTPNSAALVVEATVPNASAIPKSRILTDPSGITWMFAGLRSRWITPPPWAAASAAASWRPIAITRVGRQRLLLDQGGETLALDVLHHDERASLVLHDVVNGGDVRVRNPCGGARFADDAVAQVLAPLARRQQALQRDPAVQAGIPAEKDLAHPAFAELAQDDVRADAAAHGHIGPVEPARPVRRRVLRATSGAR